MRDIALPDLAQSIRHCHDLEVPRVDQLLDRARHLGRPLVQPRCGVGGQVAMLELLRELEKSAAPDILSLTIDSHTRLLQFEQVRAVLDAGHPERLNGYPLVNHSWRAGRELVAAVATPLQVRHGSPDARLLFHTAIASGITSFEGGGIGYNLPYVKDVPLRRSLRHWAAVDRMAGIATGEGVVVDREFFGSLTAVLMPPSISITLVLLEALLAVANGVRCVSLAYPQGGHAWQDIAALRSMHLLARRYISNDNVVIHPVLHQFMGVFPGDPGRAEALITAGGIVGALGGARKVITKSPAEAIGIPDATANARGITLTKAAIDVALTELRVDEEAVREEQDWIEREVVELIEPVLSHRDLSAAIVSAFDEGTLDCPFSASVHARSLPAPARDSSGAIRLADPGRLSLSGHSRTANASRLKGRADSSTIIADINHFSRADAADPLAWWY